jgi:DNA polymerase III epsilon subunit-like protein
LWVDVETTGLNSEKDTIIELAAICPDTGAEFHEYCLPAYKPADYEIIEALTGITWEWLKANGKKEIVLLYDFIRFLDTLVDKYNVKDKMIFAGFNTSFDNNFVRALFARNQDKYFGSYFFNILLDIYPFIAEKIISGQIEVFDNYRLSTLCEYFGIKFKAHSAIEDVKAEMLLYQKVKNLKKSVKKK